MAVLVAEVGQLGPLCANFIRPRWLMWVIYGWIWLVMDMMVSSLAIADPYSGQSISAETLPVALLGGQFGLVIVWGTPGAMRWTSRWPLALLLAVAILVPVVWHQIPATELLILFTVQNAILLALLAWLAWLNFRLLPIEPHSQPQSGASTPLPGLRESQFQLRDVLIWTAVMAITLSVARAVGYWGASLIAWQQAKAGLMRTGISAVLLPTPTAAVFTAAVILVAIWASLGAGRLRFRYSMFVFFVSLIAISHALSDYYRNAWVWRWAPRLWRGLDTFLHLEQPLLAWHGLTGGMLFAALLMFRSLGYRLCRVNRQFAVLTPGSSLPVAARTADKTAS